MKTIGSGLEHSSRQALIDGDAKRRSPNLFLRGDMRVIVTGGRDYADVDTVRLALDCLRERAGHLTVIQGGATGADAIARDWTYGLDGVTIVTVPANWHKHGKSAGPIRNQLMLDQCNPDLVLAFPGGKGTAHMMRIARKASVPVVQVHGRMRACRLQGGIRDAMAIARSKLGAGHGS